MISKTLLELTAMIGCYRSSTSNSHLSSESNLELESKFELEFEIEFETRIRTRARDSIVRPILRTGFELELEFETFSTPIENRS